MKSLTLFALLILALACPACELLYLPPATWVVFPVAEVSDDSAPIPALDAAVKGNEAILAGHTVAVLANPARGAWGSRVDDEVLDEREDENRLLAEYLEDLDLFAEVTVIDRLAGCSSDFVVSCSVDCMYTIELDGLMYVWNCMTLGLGFLIGWPHQDSAAFYVGEAIFYDNRSGEPEVVAGSVAENYKEWFCDNIYWRPGFYDAYALRPLFRQFAYDFIVRSGCLAE